MNFKVPANYSAAVLHTHTKYSDGTVNPGQLVKAAADLGRFKRNF